MSRVSSSNPVRNTPRFSRETEVCLNLFYVRDSQERLQISMARSRDIKAVDLEIKLHVLDHLNIVISSTTNL